jgi:hypothetical protein
LIYLLCSLLFIQSAGNVVYSQSDTLNTLTWSILNTPSTVNNIIAPSSEVNFIAVGSDDRTIYALDIPNSRLYKSADNGGSWNDELSASLINAGALMPIWDIAIAPDNSQMIVAVTSNGVPEPKEVFISTDGGVNWDNTNLGATNNIGDIAISPLYTGTNRDVAVGTRTSLGTGSVYTMKTPGIGGWVDQNANIDIISLEFSPSYKDDSALVVINANAANTYLNIGIRDTVANTTNWNDIYPAPGDEITTTGVSPGAAQIIVADISLPQDFNASDVNYRQYYLSYYDNNATTASGVYRKTDIEGTFYYLLSTTSTRGISSIAYYGTVAGGTLIAGEVKANTITFISDIWISINPQSISVSWEKSEKPPTGGANPVNPLDPPINQRFYANAQVAWSPEGDRLYCGTSSADIDIPAVPAPLQGWPDGYRANVALDESAFSVSPYSYDYQIRGEIVDKDMSSEPGDLWNQLGLIDTRISHLADTAALEVLDTSKSDYNIIYLSSSNLAELGDPAGTNYFDSVWRSTTLRLGDKWERIRCPASANDDPLVPDNDILLRVYSENSYESHITRSNVLTFAARGTPNLYYSDDEGQSWEELMNANLDIADFCLSSEKSIYAMSTDSLRRCQKKDMGWLWGPTYFPGFIACHTIYALPEDMQISNETDKDATRWVFIGNENTGQVAYIDFAEDNPRFETTGETQVPGNTHVIVHDQFLKNKAIFIGINDVAGIQGKMFRWILGNSTEWTPLNPPNNAFYGLVMDRDVLYGAWRLPAPPNTTVGTDRTLYSLRDTPPPLEWDDLTINITPGVLFTRQPSALKLSGNDNNTLWAIDDRPYDWANQVGCLWYFIDTLAKKGPKPISPPLDGVISADPVTGRSSEVNFSWYQLKDAFTYELQLSKDDEFSKQLIVNPAIIPYDQIAPAWILQPGFLEVNHDYYWRLRATGSVEGEQIRSPYSTTMSFTVGAGLPVESPYLSVILLEPSNACGCPCDSPPAFSWSPLKDISKYRFELSDNYDMSNPIVSVETTTTAYKYDGKLNCNKNYFWRVRAIEPYPSEWSATFSFYTLSSIAPGTSEPEQPDLQQGIPMFAIILIIIIAVILFIAILVLIKTKPTFVKPSTDKSRDIHSVIGSSRNPFGKISSMFKKKDYPDESPSTYISGANRSTPTATPRSSESLFTRMKNAIIMPWRRRRYLSSDNKKDKFF